MKCKLVILAIVFLGAIVSLHQVETQGEKPLIVTTTSVISSIVEDIAGDLVDVEYIVPPSLCPGHYDIRPSDVELVRSADLILKHGMGGEWWFSNLIDTANQSGDLFVPIVSVGADWNTPDGAKLVYENVANAIMEYLGIDVSDRLESCLGAIEDMKSELLKIADENNFKDIPVVVMLWQKPFVEFLGFKIVAVLKPPEKLSESDIMEIEDNATKYGAKLVIDNMHSGTSVGERIAEDVDAVHVVLINFPGVVPEAKNLTEMMMYNAKLLEDAVEEYEYRVSIQRLEREVRILTYISIALGIILVFETLLIVVMVKRGGKVE